ncbi:MAG: ABC transporter permease, partial [Candidatus Atribacteria bacterium]|nr:ABC transporter permease [Candidatus Atribacteria bacterium]
MTSEKIVSSEPDPPYEGKTRTNSTFIRVFRYSLLRLVSMMVTVTIGVYLTILIANMGGYVDIIMRNEIRDNTTQSILANPNYRSLSPEAKGDLIQTKIATEINRLGLNQPFAVRSVRFLKNALTLNLGRAINMKSDQGSKEVRLILLERLPATLLLTGSSSLIVFFASVYIALSLSRKYGSFWDKVTIAFSPTSAAPPWFYGIFLILIFAAIFKILPFGGLVDSPSPDNPLGYGLSVLKHLILPASSVII